MQDFCEETVQATSYQRLNDRMGSIENEVGEIQPIVSQFARAIQSAVMAKIGETATRSPSPVL